MARDLAAARPVIAALTATPTVARRRTVSQEGISFGTSILRDQDVIFIYSHMDEERQSFIAMIFAIMYDYVINPVGDVISGNRDKKLYLSPLSLKIFAKWKGNRRRQRDPVWFRLVRVREFWEFVW